MKVLTKRESEICELLGKGYTNVGVAKKLRISPNTVLVHTTHILDKLRSELLPTHKGFPRGVILAYRFAWEKGMVSKKFQLSISVTEERRQVAMFLAQGLHANKIAEEQKKGINSVRHDIAVIAGRLVAYLPGDFYDNPRPIFLVTKWACDMDFVPPIFPPRVQHERQ